MPRPSPAATVSPPRGPASVYPCAQCVYGEHLPVVAQSEVRADHGPRRFEGEGPGQWPVQIWVAQWRLGRTYAFVVGLGLRVTGASGCNCRDSGATSTMHTSSTCFHPTRPWRCRSAAHRCLCGSPPGSALAESRVRSYWSLVGELGESTGGGERTGLKRSGAILDARATEPGSTPSNTLLAAAESA